MYKNFVKFTFDGDKSQDILRDFSWQQHDIVSQLLCNYIPKSIKEIVPINDMYELSWTSVNSYNNLLNDSQFKLISRTFSDYGINIAFLPG